MKNFDSIHALFAWPIVRNSMHPQLPRRPFRGWACGAGTI